MITTEQPECQLRILHDACNDTRKRRFCFAAKTAIPCLPFPVNCRKLDRMYYIFHFGDKFLVGKDGSLKGLECERRNRDRGMRARYRIGKDRTNVDTREREGTRGTQRGMRPLATGGSTENDQPLFPSIRFELLSSRRALSIVAENYFIIARSAGFECSWGGRGTK